MQLTEELKLFIRCHSQDDMASLLLKRAQYPGIDVPFAVSQIQARRQIKGKLPSWYADDSLVFPSRLSTEQCSSEETARYKQRLIEAGTHVCDLTGGLGIDSYFFSRKAAKVTYMERFPEYCEAALLNFKTLQADNMEVIPGDSLQQIGKVSSPDVFYIDPARRGEGNKRVFALQDCEPDLLQWKEVLLNKAPKVIAKVSPMADIQHTLSLLEETTQIHVLSVRNECKELLFVLEQGGAGKEPSIHCVNFTAAGEEQSFQFFLSSEYSSIPCMANEISAYLYEPNTSILKAGAFKYLSRRLGIAKLHVNSHLYTAEEEIPDFPGRVFKVDEVVPFHNKICKELSRRIPRANITVRNFPLSVEELRKRTKITEGGKIYLFATTQADGNRVLVRCRKAGL